MNKKFLIIDSNAIIHRAYHALPPLKTKKGELVNAIYGFCLIFFKALKDIEPDFVVACFDVKGRTFRHKQFAEYKAKRVKAPDELYEQINGVKKLLQSFNVPIFEKQGFEADDLIGTIVKQSIRKQVKPKVENIILTGDMDALQLVSSQTKVYGMRRGVKDVVMYDIKATKERYGGLAPEQLTDYRALRGDPSDNIPGVTGIGEKTAISLLLEFQTLENLYNNLTKVKEKTKEKLFLYKDQAFISKTLAQIDQNVDIDFKIKEAMFDFQKERVEKVLQYFEFYALADKIPGKEKQGNLEFDKVKSTIFDEINDYYVKGLFSKKIKDLEVSLVNVIAEMKENGIKLDVSCLMQFSKKLEKEIKTIAQKIFKEAGTEFNINSTQQLSTILFDQLKITSIGLKKTKKGAISTNAKELYKIKHQHKIIGLILQYRELFKLQSAFVDALPRMINKKTGRIHPNFHQLGTETGRMSCSDPNLQNIPKQGIGLETRKCFTPSLGFYFLSADYSQMELRVAAHVSQDQKMIASFRKGEDIHKRTAKEIFHHEDITKEERDLAKTLNFGVLYGMGPVAFAERTGLTRQEAKDFIERYFLEFQGLFSYIENVKDKTKKQQFSETQWGRKRFLPEINSIDNRMRSQAERMAVNMPLQGFAADIMKQAMVDVSKILSGNCRLILQIHDELIFEVKKGTDMSDSIRDIMENVVKLSVPLRIDIKSGRNWKELI